MSDKGEKEKTLTPSPTNPVSFLQNAPINILSIREAARKELQSILESVGKDQRKALILDKSISGPLGLVAEVDLLKKLNVEQIYHLTSEDLLSDCPCIIFMVRPSLELMKVIARQIQQHRSFLLNLPSNAKKSPQLPTYSVIFTPRKALLCEKLLGDLGVLGDLTLKEFHLDLIPFDQDTLSMELPTSFRECFLEGDPSSLYYIARSLMKLQNVFGVIPQVYGKGNMSYRIWQLMQRMRREQATVFSSSSTSLMASEIDCLILIDRQVDQISPLLTQTTYEGLIDELFSIKNTFVDVDADIVAPKSDQSASSPAQPAKKKVPLNSGDTVFQEIRDLQFRSIGSLLHKKAEYIKETYSERHSAQSVQSLQTFIGKFKSAHAEHLLLTMHINLSERISETTKSKAFDQRIELEQSILSAQDVEMIEQELEDKISKREPLLTVLRLLSLFAQCCGIRSKKVDNFRRMLQHAYGFDCLLTMHNLEKLGMWTDKKSAWPALRKSLRCYLTEEELQKEKEKDKEHAQSTQSEPDFLQQCGGYVPLSVRLVEYSARPGWRRMEELLSLLPGKTFEAKQEASIFSPTSTQVSSNISNTSSSSTKLGSSSASSTVTKDSTTSSSSLASARSLQGKRPLCLVFFVGGCTHSEINALRLLSERESHRREYIVATTKLINGTTFLEGLQEQLQSKLSVGSLFKDEV